MTSFWSTFTLLLRKESTATIDGALAE